MKVLLIADNKQITEVLSVQLSGQLAVTVQQCASSREGVETLEKEDAIFDLAVVPFGTAESTVLLPALKKKKDLPVIFYIDPAVAEPKPENIAGIQSLGAVKTNALVDGVIAIGKKYLEGEGHNPALLEYCPIRTELLLKVTPLKNDIFIRLSKEKHIKIFQSGDEFNQADFKKYAEDKKIQYMYLRRGETAEFIGKFKKELDVLINKKDAKPEQVMAAVANSQETLQSLINHVGFTPEVQAVAKQSVQLAMKAIGEKPKLSGLLKRVTSAGNYLSQHSTLLAEICCCVAKEMQWGSDTSFNKLVLASLMHDVAVPDAELAKISTLKELEEKKATFTAEAVKGYHLHPMKAAEVVRGFQEIPADVDVIVAQHHERPNGGGFPRGIAHNHIAPLAVVFIIAHDLTRDILDKQDKFSLPAFIEQVKPFYNQGNFKKVITALANAKL